VGEVSRLWTIKKREGLDSSIQGKEKKNSDYALSSEKGTSASTRKRGRRRATSGAREKATGACKAEHPPYVAESSSMRTRVEKSKREKKGGVHDCTLIGKKTYAGGKKTPFETRGGGWTFF